MPPFMKTPAKTVRFALLFCLILGFSLPTARAFSLLGPFEPWMTTANGFNPATEIGGPLDTANGYRWNVPVVTYGFDQSFLEYYGSNGVAAVESAINTLNSLPPASQMNPSNYNDYVTAFNYEAVSEGLVDLKSETLFLLLEHLGLASPAQSAFILKSFTITNGAVDGQVLLRNFDPFSDQPSTNENDIPLTYSLSSSINGTMTNAQVQIFPLDPADYPNYLSVADGLQQLGSYFTGLSRDDIGGLKFLYSTNNVNYETLLPDVQSAGTNTIVNGAWRQGVDKVTFVFQPVDPLTGRAFSPLVSQYTDTYLTNNILTQQTLKRVINKPDILFSAAALANTLAWYDRTGTTNWINNGSPLSMPGPGVIQPPVNITFNQLGQVWQSSGLPDDSASENLLTAWGVFDGSTNAPIVCPPPSTGIHPTTFQLTLMVNNFPVNYRWQITDTYSTYSLQTTTNVAGLGGWKPLFTFPLNGTISSYINWNPGSAQRFYRVMPQ